MGSTDPAQSPHQLYNQFFVVNLFNDMHSPTSSQSPHMSLMQITIDSVGILPNIPELVELF